MRLRRHPSIVRVERIIVIGAGIAGLSAARVLQAHGFSVEILEARNRLGGRIHTDVLPGGVPVELGAAWVHGLLGNPLRDLLCQFRLGIRRTDYSRTPYLVGPAGRISVRRCENAHRRMESWIESIRLRRGRVREAHGLRATQAVQQRLEADSDSRLCRHLLHSEYEQDYAADLAELPARCLWEDMGYRGGHALVDGGLSQLVECLAAGIPVRFGQVVTRVDWGQNVAVIHTENHVWNVDAAIVTVPLGVLKAGHIRFSPALPKAIELAIQRLGFGLLNKTILGFAECFWPLSAEWIEFLADGKDSGEVFFNAAKYCGHPVLVHFRVGKRAAAMEACDDAESVRDSCTILRRMFRRAKVEPTSFKVTRWGKDSFARGAYSHPTPQTRRGDVSAFARSAEKVLYFAGEATSEQDFGTIHGAYASGVRAANRLMAERRR